MDSDLQAPVGLLEETEDTQTDTLVEEPQDVENAENERPWAKLLPLWGSAEPIVLYPTPPRAQLQANTYVIGRGRDADVQVRDKRVSSKHCCLFYDMRGHFYLKDLGSVNGVGLRRPGRGFKKLTKQEVVKIKNNDEIVVLKLKKRERESNPVVKPFCFVFIELFREHWPVKPGTMSSHPDQATTEASGAPMDPSPVGDAEVNAKYEFHKVMGKGACGVVYKAKCRLSGRICAVKAIHLQRLSGKTPLSGSALAREAELMQRLDHPSIIKLYEVISCESCLYLVMEIVHGGDLFDRVVAQERFCEADARKLMRRILEAVKYLHDEGVVHRDLKLENILMVSKNDNTDMKLTDFGLAAKLNTDGLRTFCGTPQYFAPEVLRRRSTVHGLGRYGREADMWSVGVILYMLLSGAPPFRSDRLERQIATGDYSFSHPVWKGVSKEAIDLVRKLIEVNPTVRLSAQQALEHPWIASEEPIKSEANEAASHEAESPPAKRKKCEAPAGGDNDDSTSN
uniref:Uncharacterized protein n=1 Tax=Pinguiococcus pyrenoidosus TaxID=172671 RepID=A0A7R9U7E5_9STRA|mmetsp:Transcript_15605/g.59283  ORF Transcript_15605/g.59283 Transcript_15605/m.59283 type:complete len:511 (+) Transcript_15605:272-1804(+)|eukprot:scaffold8_cov249-Pinguiococcus_pyrenoidosus.AAC.5